MHRHATPKPQPTFFSKDVFLANALGSSSQPACAVLALYGNLEYSGSVLFCLDGQNSKSTIHGQVH